MSNQKGYTQNQIGFQPARGFPTVPIGSVTAPGIIAQPLNTSGQLVFGEYCRKGAAEEYEIRHCRAINKTN